MPQVTTLERAFQLARSGECENTKAVAKVLKAEGFDVHQIEGLQLMRQLTDLCREAQGKPPAFRGGRPPARAGG